MPSGALAGCIATAVAGPVVAVRKTGSVTAALQPVVHAAATAVAMLVVVVRKPGRVTVALQPVVQAD